MVTGTISYWVIAMIRSVSFLSCTNHCYVLIDHIKHVVPFLLSALYNGLRGHSTLFMQVLGGAQAQGKNPF